MIRKEILIPKQKTSNTTTYYYYLMKKWMTFNTILEQLTSVYNIQELFQTYDWHACIHQNAPNYISDYISLGYFDTDHLGLLNC